MKIGNLELDKNKAILAPMAGVADRAFREICKSYGASYVISEMVSSKGLVMQDRKSRELLILSDEEQPAGVQIFGDVPEIMAESAEKCLDFAPKTIDINMGCPAPKIAGNGGGSALMKNPELVGKIVKAVVNSVDIPVTVKIRSGWDSFSINAVEIAKICEYNGASAVTVHGRTKEQMYAPPVMKDVIAEVKKNLNIPVIANGDIVDGITAEKMYDYTKSDLIMVGRGALGRPWVFRQIEEYLKNGIVIPEPPVEERMRVMIKHISLLCEYKGERIGMREARKHASWYIKGLPGASKFRLEAGKLDSINGLIELANKVIADNK